VSACRRLVVSGDDFGAAPEVNAAIVRAHRDGILTSASLMVTGDAVDDAVARARAHPRLAVGLHLVLVQGRPALPPREIPRIVTASGTFPEQPVLAGLRYAWLAVALPGGRDELKREIEAQLRAFAATGLRLAHVDGHVNIHLHPMILPLLLELAPKYGIRALRLSRESLASALRWDLRSAPRKVAEGLVFRALSAWSAARLREAGIVTADCVYGMHQTGHVDESYLLSVIETLPPGLNELYCHPADVQPAALARHQVGYDHAGEVAALVSPRVRHAVEAAGIELVTYPDVVAS